MSLQLNHVTIAGNLTRVPEVKTLAGDRSVCSFGVATNRKWKDKAGDLKEEATFIECTAWGRTAELVGQYLRKGSPVYIEGRLSYETWDDKDGKKQSKTRVTVENVQFLGQKPVDSTPEPAPIAQPRTARPPVPVASVDDSLDPPF